MNIKNIYKIVLAGAGLCLIAIILIALLGYRQEVGLPFVAFFALGAIGIRAYPHLKGFSFTVWVFAAVSLAMFYPALITEVGGYDTKGLIVPLVQLIMFGMGTTMSLSDFESVVNKPKGVLVGIVCQFTIMPLVGIALALSFSFQPEIAAGVVLIGSSPSGVASNVMSYLAKADVALSLTLTSIATLLAPLITPFLMELLAGQFVPIDFLSMMVSILSMVILPIAFGLVVNRIFRGRDQWLHKTMPIVSMIGIVVIIAVITAAGRDNLLVIGLALVGAAIIHNAAGYFLGYWSSRILGMDERSCRTIAIEVGMQNGGLASGIAAEMGRAATMGLAPAIFGPWMNVSGSFLANWWRDKTIEGEKEKPESDQQIVVDQKGKPVSSIKNK